MTLAPRTIAYVHTGLYAGMFGVVVESGRKHTYVMNNSVRFAVKHDEVVAADPVYTRFGSNKVVPFAEQRPGRGVNEGHLVDLRGNRLFRHQRNANHVEEA